MQADVLWDSAPMLPQPPSSGKAEPQMPLRRSVCKKFRNAAILLLPSNEPNARSNNAQRAFTNSARWNGTCSWNHLDVYTSRQEPLCNPVLFPLALLCCLDLQRLQPPPLSQSAELADTRSTNIVRRKLQFRDSNSSPPNCSRHGLRLASSAPRSTNLLPGHRF